jgi:hypothetical protein
MVTRFNAQVSGIFIRRSADSGASWLADQLIAPINVWQADPQVQVADDGTVFAVWLDGPNWTSKLVKSYDHGATLDCAGGNCAVFALDRPSVAARIARWQRCLCRAQHG